MKSYPKNRVIGVVAADTNPPPGCSALWAIVLCRSGQRLRRRASRSQRIGPDAVPSQSQATRRHPIPAVVSDNGTKQTRESGPIARRSSTPGERPKNKPKAKHVYTDDNLSAYTERFPWWAMDLRAARRNGSSVEAPVRCARGRATKQSRTGDRSAPRSRTRLPRPISRVADVKLKSRSKDPLPLILRRAFRRALSISHDRNAEVKQLEDRKRSLENQLDELGDEARRAGAGSRLDRADRLRENSRIRPIPRSVPVHRAGETPAGTRCTPPLQALNTAPTRRGGNHPLAGRTSIVPPLCVTRSMPWSTIVYSSNSGVCPGSSQPAGLRMCATLSASSLNSHGQ